MIKRVFYFVTEDWYFVSHRLPLAIAAKAAGYDVTVVTRVIRHGDVIRDAGLKLIPFENSRTGINPLTELSTIVRLSLLYRKERPDLVHHVAIKPVLYGSIAARVAGIRQVVNAIAGMGWLFSSGSGLARWLKPLVRRALARLLGSGVTLVQNRDDARLMCQLGVPPERVRRIAGSGVDMKRFQMTPQPVGVPLVVLPARLLWEKGIAEFVAAARQLKQERVEARFALIGEPDPQNPSGVPDDQIKVWVEEGVVEYPGWVQDMPALLAKASIVCLPTFYGEGIPKSLIEAAAAGRPIVTTDAPGCREVVVHGENGLLVPIKDVPALVGALRSLLGDVAARERMGARGRARAEREFALETVLSQTLLLYAEGRE